MSIFLFLKQITDMFYQYKLWDTLMVVWVILLLAYQVALVRPDIRKSFSFTDAVVLGLAGLLSINFLRFHSGYQMYFKVLSAFLMYFVGRIYYDRIKECGGALVAAAYIVVYANLIDRIYRFGFSLTKVENAGGDFYFQDTDMAFAMILALVFITMLGKNTVLKLVTIFLVCPYMILFSDAGIQVMLMLAIYFIFALYVVELAFRKKKAANCILVVLLLGMVALVTILYLPVFGIDKDSFLPVFFHNRFLNNENMKFRYATWINAMQQTEGGSPLQKLLGFGMGTDLEIDSLYIKIYYAMGWIGIVLTVLFLLSILRKVARMDDRKTFYLLIMLTILLLGTGVTVNSIEYTQMSWFPMLFAGMVISSTVSEENEMTF